MGRNHDRPRKCHPAAPVGNVRRPMTSARRTRAWSVSAPWSHLRLPPSPGGHRVRPHTRCGGLGPAPVRPHRRRQPNLARAGPGCTRPTTSPPNSAYPDLVGQDDSAAHARFRTGWSPSPSPPRGHLGLTTLACASTSNLARPWQPPPARGGQDSVVVIPTTSGGRKTIPRRPHTAASCWPWRATDDVNRLCSEIIGEDFLAVLGDSSTSTSALPPRARVDKASRSPNNSVAHPSGS